MQYLSSNRIYKILPPFDTCKITKDVTTSPKKNNACASQYVYWDSFTRSDATRTAVTAKRKDIIIQIIADAITNSS